MSGLAWSLAGYANSAAVMNFRTIADHLSQGDRYSPDLIRSWADQAVPQAERTCDVGALIGGLVLAARSAENELEAADLAAIDLRFSDVHRLAVHLVRCAPTASFGWLSLFWVESFRSGADTSILPFLEESFRTGPNETWISARRAPLAMSYFSQLTPELRNQALEEFTGLVGLYQMDLALAIYTRSDDELRRRIVEALKTVPPRPRALFARRLSREGFVVDLPGLLGREDRPWLY